MIKVTNRRKNFFSYSRISKKPHIFQNSKNQEHSEHSVNTAFCGGFFQLELLSEGD